MGEWYIGAHLDFSVRDPNKTFTSAGVVSAKAIQIFMGSKHAGLIKPYTDDDADSIVRAMKSHSVLSKQVVVHAPYSINLANVDADVVMPHFNRLQTALCTCNKCAIGSLVLHPGSTLKKISTDEAIKYVSKRVGKLLASKVGSAGHTSILYENMYGAPSSTLIGKSLIELQALVEQTKRYSNNVGVCIDTAHLFSSGVNITDVKVIDSYFAEFNRLIGPKYLKCIHMNDSKLTLGCGRDTHAPIAKGNIGAALFKWIVNNPQFKGIPIVTETHLDGEKEISDEMALIKSYQSHGR